MGGYTTFDAFGPELPFSIVNTLFIVAGEVSGDTHGAALVRSLANRGDWSLSGLGGPRLAALGDDIEDWLDEAAVLGLWEVLRKYGYFRGKMEETVRRIEESRPDGVLLIDYPGFNLRLAKRLRDGGYEGKLIFYISPQVWAWKKGRVQTMAELLDLMICIFPFEKELYETSGLPTVFAGHPLVDAMEEIRDPTLERDPERVALLPGSREREIAKLFPPMLDAAGILMKDHPDLRFCTAGATEKGTVLLRDMVAERGWEGRFEVGEEDSHRIMQRAGAGVVASGTATLEAACLGLPYCLTYKVAWLTARAARFLMSVDYLGIVNVIAKREVVRELLQDDATGKRIAAELRSLIEDESRRARLQEDLASVVATLGEGGSHRRAAEAVEEAISAPSRTRGA